MIPVDDGSRAAVATGWRRLTELFNYVHAALDSTLQRDYRLSLTEYDVLVALADSTEPDLRMQVIADHVGLSQSAVSRLIGRLQSTDLVERVVCEDDRRGRYIGLTPRGRAVVEAIRPVYDAILADAIATAVERDDIGPLARAMTDTATATGAV
jgi:DNA-binding MarR family transcriptional regulator